MSRTNTFYTECLRFFLGILFLVLSCGVFADCSGDDRSGFVCGLASPEDLVAIPDSEWIVASGLKQTDQPGKLFLIDRQRKSATILFPDTSLKIRHDREAYGECPGPVDVKTFSAHGINLRTEGGGISTLYVMNHGDREAIEIFTLAPTEDTQALTWVGCVILPKGSLGNGVAPLMDKGLAATLMVVPEFIGGESASPENQSVWVPKLRDGEVSGYAASWFPDTGWQRISGAEASGPNGIETSSDSQWVWIANWGNQEVVRASSDGHTKPTVIKLNFSPDNLRWGDDGMLWVAGASTSPAAYFQCWATPGCRNEYAIGKIDPARLAIEIVPHPDMHPHFGDATSALMIDGEIWLGTHPGDRAAWFLPED